METTITALVVGIRFSQVGKIYHFDAARVSDVQIGDQVVVETSRGWQLGSVAQIHVNVATPAEGLKQIDRKATPRDLVLRQTWQSREEEVVAACKNRALELNLAGIKVVSAEYSFDGTRLAILFSSESEEKFDLKSLRADMQRAYAPAQVELRQIGPRDVAKHLCGMGACGLEQRCCSQFLCEFSSISIRMAKEQGISLTPSEITGMCGRLRCCLIYEYEQYTEARAKLPKRNKRVMTAQGEGKVIDVVPLRDAVIVELIDQGRREYPRDQIQLFEEGMPPPVMPQQVVEPKPIDEEMYPNLSDRSERIDPNERQNRNESSGRAPSQPRPNQRPPERRRSENRTPQDKAPQTPPAASAQPKPEDRPGGEQPRGRRRQGPRRRPGGVEPNKP
jgi:cell fate regulator YaaT (PSP1 superfamily)